MVLKSFSTNGGKGMPAPAAPGRFASNADRSTSKNESTPATPAIHRIAYSLDLNFIRRSLRDSPGGPTICYERQSTGCHLACRRRSRPGSKGHLQFVALTPVLRGQRNAVNCPRGSSHVFVRLSERHDTGLCPWRPALRVEFEARAISPCETAGHSKVGVEIESFRRHRTGRIGIVECNPECQCVVVIGYVIDFDVCDSEGGDVQF